MRRLGRRPRWRVRITGFRRRGLRGGRLRLHTLALLLALATAVVGFCAILDRRVAPQVRALAEIAAEQQAAAAVSAA
ncbi:MAG: hypothetical protein FWF60_09395, partial [Oscillospiraceae bacterium]|nr:hypothetical protein [Oscillospiraceae bacterium]